MEYKLFESSVVGYKNIKKGSKSQDYIDYKILDDGVICAVADGHSTDFFTYSDEGAKLACKSAISIFERLAKKLIEDIKKELQEDIVQNQIYDMWMNLVNEHYRSIKPMVFNTQYLKYSTTLVCTLITDEFRLYLKIGDGSIVVKNGNDYKNVLESKNKEVVDSLGRERAYKNFIYYIEKNNEDNKLDNIILFTDGYENSFKNKQMLFKSLENTINQYNENVFSRWILYKNYKYYLSKLSSSISKDDISIIYVFNDYK